MKQYLVFLLCFLSISCVSENIKKCWDYFISHGFTKEGAAGLLGNLQAESGVRSSIYEKSKRKKIGLTDEEYIRKTNHGTYHNFVNDRAGFGLAQWTFPSRKQNLLNHCKGKIGDLYCQLEFLVEELKLYKTVYRYLTTSHSVKDCSNKVLLKYERPKNQSPANQNRRAAMGLKIYNELVGSTIEKVPEEKKEDESEPINPETPSTEGRTYTVVRGDTLTRIAKRFGTTVQRLVELNNIVDKNKIRAGKVLRID